MFGDPSSEMGGGVDGADLGSPAKGTSGNVTALGGLVAPKLGDDIDAYLFTVLGPRALPLAWLIPLTAIYTFIFITGEFVTKKNIINVKLSHSLNREHGFVSMYVHIIDI